MRVSLEVNVPVEHAFTKAGENLDVKELTLQAYHPSSFDPRILVRCPDGTQLILRADALARGVELATVKV